MKISSIPTEFRNRYGCPLAAAKAVAVQAAASTYLQPDLREVKSLKEIGSRADAGSYGRSASDLGALVSGIIANYGTDVSSTAESGNSPQAADRVAQSRRASSSSVSELQRSGYATQTLCRDTELLEADSVPFSQQKSVAHGVRGADVAAEQAVQQAGSDVAQAEREVEAAQGFQPSEEVSLCPEERAKQERDKQLVLAVAEEYLKKAAAREAATRLQRALARVATELAGERLEQPETPEVAGVAAE